MAPFAPEKLAPKNNNLFSEGLFFADWEVFGNDRHLISS